MLRNNLMLPTEALDIPEAIDFDGTNDYLSRSSDLMGNADGKTFTFSAWVYPGDPLPGNSTHVLYSSDNSTFTSTGRFIISLTFSSGFATINTFGLVPGSQSSQALNIRSTPGKLNGNTAQHILISCDMNDAGSKFRIYLNDVNQSLQYTVYGVSDIDFAGGKPQIGRGASAAPALFKGRLSNVFLDYTYRDLSVEANRRLFITADRKPAANQQALNPILYLPLNDPTQPGKNLGTGGDFALTGVVARSGRGPNQFNAPYSDLDGTADYLSRTSVTGIADGKQVTFSCVFKHDTINTSNQLFSSADTITGKISFFTQSGGSLTIRLRDAADAYVLEFKLPNGTFVVGRNYVLTFSVDLTDTAKRSVYVNGQATSATWVTYTNANADLTNTSYSVGVSSATTRSGYFDGTIGNVFFDTRYIDLSQPANLAKFVTGTGIDAKPVDLGANGEKPFGTPPLIYLPMYGNNAGKNYGTGGDFTVNSGPFPGARGPNEFWGNKADFGSSTSNKVINQSIQGGWSADISYVIWFYLNGETSQRAILGAGLGGAGGVLVVTGKLVVYLGSGKVEFNQVVPVNSWQCLMLSKTEGTVVAYLNGTQLTINPDESYNYSGAMGIANPVCFGSEAGVIDRNPIIGSLSESYISQSYIDFSQEANRLKFRDAFGNPVDLTPQIKAGTLPNPAIYMRFPPDNFGKNYGTGGDFTVNGIITDGGQL